MQAEQSLKDGDIQLALSQLQEQVRSNPASVEYRIFLFQLLSVQGEWGRALTQLDVTGDLDAGALAMVQTYREALRCEALRHEVFAGKRSPLIFGDPEPWVALLLQSLKRSVDSQFAEAQALREEAYDAVEAPSGTVDGQGFEWIADADPRLGPFLEAIVNGNYYWVPFHRIHRIQLSQPEDLRDMIWTPAQFTWSNGGQAVGFIPTRYPDSEHATDNLLRLSRKTEWLEMAEGVYQGIGQRILVTDAGEYPLMDIRDIVIDLSHHEPDWSEATSGQSRG